MDRYDVVVVGAGLAGLQTAHLLGERGLGVLLVDRKSALDLSIHTTGIFVRRTLEDFALPEDCLGAPVRHVRLYSPSRRSKLARKSGIRSAENNCWLKESVIPFGSRPK